MSTPTAQQYWQTRGKAIKFETVGDTVTLHITDPVEVRQMRDYDDEDKLLWWDKEETRPKMESLITGQVDDYDKSDPEDTGRRTLYVKGYMEKAVKTAIRKAKAGPMPQPGADLAVTFSEEGEASGTGKKKKAPPKMFEAVYTPDAHKLHLNGSAAAATSSKAADDDEDDDEEPPF